MSMVKKFPVSAPQLTGFPVDPLVFGIAVFLMLYGLAFPNFFFEYQFIIAFVY